MTTQPRTPEAVARAATAVGTARRVLVTGLAGAAAATIAAACDLAERLGAAVDLADADVARVAGPTIARIGQVTADEGELRDRADLVVFWYCDPSAADPAFLGRCVTAETRDGRRRRTLAIGPVGGLPESSDHRHLRVPDATAVDLARVLHAVVAGRAATPPEPLAAVAAAVERAIAAAACVAFVTRHRDPVGLGAWSLVGLVRAIAHRKPAFELPLGDAASAGDTTLAAAVCTWRYGGPGAIARAEPGGSDFRPAECDALRLVDRGEVDCVVAVGPLPAALESAVNARIAPPAIVRVPADGAEATLAAIAAAIGPGAVAGGRP